MQCIDKYRFLLSSLMKGVVCLHKYSSQNHVCVSVCERFVGMGKAGHEEALSIACLLRRSIEGACGSGPRDGWAADVESEKGAPCLCPLTHTLPFPPLPSPAPCRTAPHPNLHLPCPNPLFRILPTPYTLQPPYSISTGALTLALPSVSHTLHLSRSPLFISPSCFTLTAALLRLPSNLAFSSSLCRSTLSRFTLSLSEGKAQISVKVYRQGCFTGAKVV